MKCMKKIDISQKNQNPTLLCLIVVGGGVSREVGIFLNFNKLGGHNKITLGKDRKSTL